MKKLEVRESIVSFDRDHIRKVLLENTSQQKLINYLFYLVNEGKLKVSDIAMAYEEYRL